MSELQLLPWQAPLWRTVAQAIGQDRLGHALLLSGLAGTGKRAFAKVLAAALWCEVPREQRLPCGECSNCRQVVSESHPGFRALRVEIDEEEKKKKRDISIDAVRALCERLAMTSHDGRAKLAIIDPADALNRNGVNALLKTIEEPPPRTHLVLISERPLALLPTLRSRCQQLRFAIPPREQALAWLRQSVEAEPSALEAALDAAHGAPVSARRLLEDQSLELQRDWQAAMLELAGGKGSPLQAAADILKSFTERRDAAKKKRPDEGGGAPVIEREDEQARSFLFWLYGWLLRLLRRNLAPQAGPGGEGLPAGHLPFHALDQYIAEVQEQLQRLESNARVQLVLEALLIRWTALVALGRRS